MPVAESMPNQLHCHTLTVMHIRLGWIVAQHSIHDDDLLSEAIGLNCVYTENKNPVLTVP